MQILKFGGSSIATPERVKTVMDIIKGKMDRPVAVVFSAFGGVTDHLIEISQLALKGDLSYKAQLKELEKRHLNAVRELTGVSKQSGILAETKSKINELEDVLHGVYLVKERTIRTLDYIMSFGERLSTYIIAESFKDRGIQVEYLDAREIIRTDNTFGDAHVDFSVTNQLITERFEKYSAPHLVTGFISSSEEGETTTLGRSGSDYTAAILAGALKAEVLEIWTDVDGMMTADPRAVKKAFSVGQLSYEEAMELSHFGAKVIFPATMQPAMIKQIPIAIKNTFNPSCAGTRISAESSGDKLVKGISSMNGISLLNVQGSGLLGVVGVSKRLFTVLAEHKVNVILISQASSEHSICVAINTSAASLAKKAIEKEFRLEIKDKLVEQVKVQSDLSIVAAVGDGMKNQSGTSGRMFNALGRNGVNVVAIAQGASERNISIVVEQNDVSKALNALHDAFFLSDLKTVHLYLVGTGLIGKTLLEQISTHQETLTDQSQIAVKLVGVANSRKMYFNEDGIPLDSAIDQLLQQSNKMEISSFIKMASALNLPNSVLVDCTASQDIADQYAKLLEENISIVTPNKKANSGSWETYVQLKDLAKKRNVKFLYETNVGAGLPVINTLNDLILSGDKVLRIEAVLSGTLNYIFSTFEPGLKFSEVVAGAKEKGFTEPDPRDDLSGMDVARKILILARESGMPLELEDVTVQNLVPEDCRGDISPNEFVEKLKDHDASFDALLQQASNANKKLRYSAILENGKAVVQLTEVEAGHPFYGLSGSDNVIMLMTERYHERPLIVQGPGAGAEVTAAGVFADIIWAGSFGR